MPGIATVLATDPGASGVRLQECVGERDWRALAIWWRLGGWQGYQGTDFEAIVDVGSIKHIHHCAVGCLQDVGSWIWMPSKVEFFLSDDGQHFQKIGEVVSNIAVNDYSKQIKDFGINLNRYGRYIKVRAVNLGIVPAWHPGAGDKTFIFLDEIVVK